jgi:hypothetical protein
MCTSTTREPPVNFGCTAQRWRELTKLRVKVIEEGNGSALRGAISSAKPDERVRHVRFTSGSIVVDLMDSRTISVPLA